MECMKKKARDWKIRLLEEVRTDHHGAEFVTLTFSNESITDLISEAQTKAKAAGKEIKGYELDNYIATLAIKDSGTDGKRNTVPG